MTFVDQIASGKLSIDGILTASDTHALRVYELLKQRGIQIPALKEKIHFNRGGFFLVKISLSDDF